MVQWPGEEATDDLGARHEDGCDHKDVNIKMP